MSNDFSVEGEFTPITKATDEAENLVFGWASISKLTGDDGLVLDLQSDEVEPEELEKAAYEFVLNFRETGDMHEGDPTGTMVESFFVTPEKLAKMGFPPDARPAVERDGQRVELDSAWFLGFYVEDDEQYAKVLDGTRRQFSIQGQAVREAVV